MVAIAAVPWREKDRSNLCEAPSGPFRQIGPVPFFPLYRDPLLNLTQAVASIALIVSGWAAWHDRHAIAMRTFAGAADRHGVHCRLLPAAGVAASFAGGMTWVGSMVVMVGLVHAAVWNYTGVVWQPWLTRVLLTHSTLAAVASLLLRGMAACGFADDRHRGSCTANAPSQSSNCRRRRHRRKIRRVLSTPLGDSAVLSSAADVGGAAVRLLAEHGVAGRLPVLAGGDLAGHRLAAPQRPAVRRSSTHADAGDRRGDRRLAESSVLVRQSGPAICSHPYSLQAFGVALGVLSLLWIVARIALRGNATAEQLLNPSRPTVDWVVRHRWSPHNWRWSSSICCPASARNWLERSGVFHRSSADATEHLRRRGMAPAGRAGRDADRGPLAALAQGGIGQRAVAGWPLCRASWPAGLSAIWPWRRHCDGGWPAASSSSRRRFGSRTRLAESVCRQARMSVDLEPRRPVGSLTACRWRRPRLPVLALTVVAAFCQFGGATPGGPAVDTFFHRIGPSLSYLVPLASSSFAWSATPCASRRRAMRSPPDWLPSLAVALGYSLSVVLAPRPFGTAELVTLLQLATITAAAWMLAWLAARRWVDVWREAEKGDRSNLPERPSGCFAQIGPVPFSAPSSASCTCNSA